MSFPRTSRAFTLVELLVVIGIIALLIGVLLPSLAAARRSSQMLKCSANLRTLGLAFQSYALVNNDRLPAVYTSGYDDVNSYVFFLWYQRLMLDRHLPGLNDPDKNVLICPADDEPYRAFTLPSERDYALCSYGINPFASLSDVRSASGAVDARGNPKPDGIDDDYNYAWPKRTKFRGSAAKILASDIVEGERLNIDEPNTPGEPPQYNRWAWSRHGGGSNVGKWQANVLYFDGHVDKVRCGYDTAGLLTNDVSGFKGSLGAAVNAKAAAQFKP